MIPLSTKMRPSTLDGFVGQTHFLFEGSLFYNSIKNKTFDSAIFFGPSGTGKTTLARIIARELDSNFVEINASVTGASFPGVMAMAWLLSPARGRLGMWLGIHQKKR